MTYSLANLAEQLDAEIIGDANLLINNLASIINAQDCDIVYFADKKFSKLLQDSKAIAVITTAELQDLTTKAKLIVKNPALASAKLSQILATVNHSIHTSAIIDGSASIGKNVHIDANCYIGKNVKIDDNCYFYAGVNIMDNVKIGKNVKISSGSVIGSQGFGNVWSGNNWQTIHHFGSVVIGDDVNLGANITIDNGTFDNTVIENGVRIDNLVHIAHNVKIGENTAIAAKTGIAGSTIIGKNCQIGGMVGIIGHLKIADGVVIYATSTVNKSLHKAGFYTGFLPIMPHKNWKKIAFLLTKFDKIIKFLNIKVTKL